MRLLLVLAYCGITLTLLAQSSDQKVSDATFQLIENGKERIISYSEQANLIFAERYGNEVWIRLAESKNGDGEKSPHLDIDLCNFSGDGTYKPIDPKSRPCKEDFKWDIWWHDEQEIYANQSTSSPCELIIRVNGDTLSGTFTCNDLLLMNSTKTIDINSGSFKAVIRN